MFELSPEQKDIRQAAREFAEKEFTDIARELDNKEEFDERLWKKAAELGFLGMFIEEEYGGPGMGHLDQTIVKKNLPERIPYSPVQGVGILRDQLIKLYGTENKEEIPSGVCSGK